MGSIELLQWDSNFFNIKIGKCTILHESSEVHLLELLQAAQQDNYKLLYLFSDPNISIPSETLDLFKGDLVDTKIIFDKRTMKSKTSNSDIISYRSSSISDELLQLALLSGQYSRFNTDIRFSADSFKRMYGEWLEKSVSRKIANEVFVYKKGNNIVGFVTISFIDNIGTIGLIAVDPSCQGQHIGKALLQKASDFLHSSLVPQIQVATQHKNIVAYNFYLRNDFTIRSEQDIYHFSL